MTVAQIVDMAQGLYGDPAGTFLTDALALTRLNYLKSRIERETRCYRVSTAVELTDSTRTYIVPAKWFAFRKDGVRVTGAPAPLVPIDQQALIEKFPTTWDTQEDTYPQYYYLDEAMKTVSQTTNYAIGVYPIPVATIASGLNMRGYGLSADFSADTESPPWPEHTHETLAWALCWFTSITDGGMQMDNEKMLTMFRQEYERCKRELRGSSLDASITNAPMVLGEGAGAPADPTLLENILVITYND